MQKPLSKTQQAIQLMETEGITPYAAAERVGIKTSGLYVALARRQRMASHRCPHCGAPVDTVGNYVPRTGD